jgi:hypothetical protein
MQWREMTWSFHGWRAVLVVTLLMAFTAGVGAASTTGGTETRSYPPPPAKSGSWVDTAIAFPQAGASR